MTVKHYRQNLSRGELYLTRDDETGKWRMTWLPTEEATGSTYSPGDSHLPEDFPGFDDPGRAHRMGPQALWAVTFGHGVGTDSPQRRWFKPKSGT